MRWFNSAIHLFFLKTITLPAAALQFIRKAPTPLVLVPTMGALHEGHLALIRHARKLAGKSGRVVVTIFVNPAQFGPKEDFSKYPRPLATDRKLCRENGVDLLFTPSANDLYGPYYSTWVDEITLSDSLCGKSRPGHFKGVCTVVAKLFNLIRPDMAVFGMKDFQQLAIIQRMVRDLNFPVKIIAVETVREPDGLALSSRNRFLLPEERIQASVIRQSLLQAGKLVKSGETNVIAVKRSILRQISKAPLAVIDYLEIVDLETLRPVTLIRKNNLIAIAVFFGKTRLIDNLLLS